MRRALLLTLLIVVAGACDSRNEMTLDATRQPPTSCPGSVCMIETRDGEQLSTWIGLPAVVPDGGVAAIVWRTPYRISGNWVWQDFADFLNKRGYAFVLQDVRGRPDSTGTFDPLRHEIEDGQDTTRWIVQQPWSNGRIGMIGGSYDGYTAVAAAVDNPHVKFVITDDGTTDERSERIGGTFSTHTLSWLQLVRTGDWLDGASIRALTNALDPRPMDEALIGRVEPYWREALAQDGTALWPVDGSLEPRFGDLCVPTLHVYSQASGWNDPIDIWRGMRDQGCSAHANDQFLIVTPDPHVHHLGLLGLESTPVNELMLQMLDAHLGEGAIDTSAIPRVQWVQHGEQALRPLAGWPAGTEHRTFYFARGPTPDDGSLTSSPNGPATTAIDVDPGVMDPCSATYPVHWYTTTPLTDPITIAGRPRVEIELESTVPDTDLVVDLYDWNPARTDEPYIHLGWGAVRAKWRHGEPPRPLVPGNVVAATLVLTASAHQLVAGSHVVLSLAPGGCGLLENPQTGEPVTAQTERRAGTVTIWHDAVHPSRVMLPVLPP